VEFYGEPLWFGRGPKKFRLRRISKTAVLAGIGFYCRLQCSLGKETRTNPR
jgi:hypothetical protein